MSKDTAQKVLLLNVTFNHDSDTLSGALGISDDRYKEIKKTIDDLLGEDGATPSTVIEKCLKSFDKPNELVFALYAISGEASNGPDSLAELLSSFNDGDDQDAAGPEDLEGM